MRQSLCIAITAVAFCIPCAFAETADDYSGNYLLQTGKSKTDSDFALAVVHNGANVRLTEIQKGKETTNVFSLDGLMGDYVSPGGIAGRCRGQLKGKVLVLETFIISRVLPDKPPVRMHTIERWKLSSDRKILTIRRDVDFPDFSDVAAAVNRSETDKYARTQ